MIVTLLILYNYCISLLRYVGFNTFFERKDWGVLIFDVPKVDGVCTYSKLNGIKFSPPLFLQRYEVVKEILNTTSTYHGGALRVIDFGCSEIGFFRVIKHMKGVQEYIAVDVNIEILNRYSCKVLPLTFDYLKKRTEPLLVQLLCGSVSQPDRRLQNCNAVVAIELIEHLYPDVLEELPYNIFGLIQPEIAVFTTPNSEFNIFFPLLKGFRHDDHKFEWTREQFQSWANNLVLRYPNYKVVFGGVGTGPNSRLDFGYCTQIALFFRNAVKFDTSSKFCDLYKVVKEVEYPFTTEIERTEEIIRYETEKFILNDSKLNNYKTDDRIAIPLKDIHSFLHEQCTCTEDHLWKVLSSCGRTIDTLENGTKVLILPLYREEDDDSYLSSPSSLEDNEQQYFSVLQPNEEEDWDDILSLTVMDPFHNGLEKSNEMGGGPFPGEIDQQESPSFNNESSFETSNPSSININSQHQRLELEEPRSSSSAPNEKCNIISQSYIKYNSGTSAFVKNENSEEKSSDETSFIRTSLQKCHSLENMNRDRSRSSPFRFSLNIDKDKLIDCDIGSSGNSNIQKESSALTVSDTFVPRQEDSCSQSKAADSGYPNSYGQDMDMDLTPEQVDEIITESESSFDGDVDDESGGDEDEPIEIHGEIVRLGENVENGDVANNNRDGEGNNMEAVVAAGGILQFEQVIAEEEVGDGNLAAAVIPDLDEDLGFLSVGDRIIVSGNRGEPCEIHPDPVENPDFLNDAFPDWLLSILADDEAINGGEDDGAGDAVTLRQQGILENEESNDEAESELSFDPLSDLDILDGPPIELIVEGDVMGGGEPSPAVE